MEFQAVWKGNNKQYPKLTGNIERDIVVIGGGIAGFLTAFKLSEAGRNVTLIEADRLFSGTTGKTTAKITCNQGCIYADLFMRYSLYVASLYYRSQADAMQEFSELVRKFKIQCDWEETDSYIFSYQNNVKLELAYKVLTKSGANCRFLQKGTPFHWKCALEMEKQYLFDPLKFLNALPVRFEIFEHTRAVEVDVKNKTVRTEEGRIWGKTLIIATHYPIIISHGWYFMKLRQSTSYTVAVEGRHFDEMALEEKEDGISIRPYAGGTLLGGFDHRTGRMKSGGYGALKKKAGKLFGNVKIKNCWCAEDVMTFDGMPMVGRLANNLKDVYVITGFNKWGMTNSMLSADIMRDIVLNKDNPYLSLLSPQRKIKRSLRAFASNVATNVKGIFNGYIGFTLKTEADIRPDSGAIVNYKGKRRAVYKDKDGKLYVIGRMCPHMHCELSWNDNSKTWDCPCHGSRFDIHGNILSEPAVKKCKKEEETDG